MKKIYITMLLSLFLFSLCQQVEAKVIHGETDFYFIKKLAKNGDVPSMLTLGYIYGSAGSAYGGDTDKAIMWFKRAAKSGETSAMYKLYEIYEGKSYMSNDVNHMEDKDDKKIGLKWLRKAANNNYSLAQDKLGDLYDTGEFGDENRNLAYGWYEKSARNGSIHSQLSLAAIHMMGALGKKNNFEKAIFWYTKAAESGSARGQNGLCDLYNNQLNMTPKKYQNNLKAFNWCFKAAKNRNSLAQNTVSEMYFMGKGVERNYIKAYAWMKTYYANKNLGAIFRKYETSTSERMYSKLSSGVDQANAEITAISYISKYVSNDSL